MKNIFLLFIISFLNFTFAQDPSNGTLTGKIIDESSGSGIQLVNIVVLKAIDSAQVTGTASLKDGKFTVTGIPAGKYRVKFSSIGYKEKYINDVVFSQKINKKELGEIILQPVTVDLNEILVSSKKESFNNSIDRKVYNVEKDIMSKTGTASELLQNIPSVQVDIDGNISLRGSGNVIIMINGKTSPLLAKSAPAVLEQMPANSIEKIEVITNPSAKYKPDGNSGIINIVLKKDTGTGLNGAITGNVGNKERYNGNISINYNPGTVNIYGSYGFRQDNRSRYNTDNRELYNATGTVFYNDKSSSTAKPFFQIASGGMDYSIDKKNKLGFSLNYMHHDMNRDETNLKKTFNSNNLITEDYDRIRKENSYEKELETSVNFQHNFPEEDHTLKAEFKYSYSPELEENKYSNFYRTPLLAPGYDNTSIYQSGLQKNIDIEYSNPLSDNSTLEAGYAGEFDTPEFSYRGETYSDNLKTFVRDFNKTNHFVMDEQINAMYTTYSKSFGAFGFLAGLRAENAFVKSHLIDNDSVISSKAFNLFPTMHLSYKFSETDQVQLNYSKRIRRPEGDDLNPFPEYQDPKNIRAGNPNLLPEFYHSIEFGYQKQFEHISFIPSIYYRYTNNKFTSVIKPLNDSVFLTTMQNLSSDQSAGLEFILSASYNGTLSSNLSANVFYSEIDASNIGYSSKKSTTAWSGSWNFNVNFTSTTMFQMNSNYRSVRLTPQGEYNASYVVNFGVRQDLFDDKVSLIFTLSDLFNSLKRKMELNTSLLKQYAVNERDSRIFYLGVTYHFGRSEKKSKEKQLQYDDKL